VARPYRLGPFRRLTNAALTPAIRLGLVPRQVHLLTTRGRKSGVERTTPVQLVDLDGARYLVAPYGAVAWVHNARQTGEVKLSRGRVSSVHSVEEVGPAEAAPVLQRYLKAVPVVRPYFDVTIGSPVSEFEAESRRHPVFRLGPARQAL
jgi:deazaflavin-dependent oxidoreductase (nitroreductase family)